MANALEVKLVTQLIKSDIDKSGYDDGYNQGVVAAAKDKGLDIKEMAERKERNEPIIVPEKKTKEITRVPSTKEKKSDTKNNKSKVKPFRLDRSKLSITDMETEELLDDEIGKLDRIENIYDVIDKNINGARVTLTDINKIIRELKIEGLMSNESAVNELIDKNVSFTGDVDANVLIPKMIEAISDKSEIEKRVKAAKEAFAKRANKAGIYLKNAADDSKIGGKLVDGAMSVKDQAMKAGKKIKSKALDGKKAVKAAMGRFKKLMSDSDDVTAITTEFFSEEDNNITKEDLAILLELLSSEGLLKNKLIVNEKLDETFAVYDTIDGLEANLLTAAITRKERLKQVANRVGNAVRDTGAVKFVESNVRKAASNTKGAFESIISGEYTYDSLKDDINKTYLDIKEFEPKKFIKDVYKDKIVPMIKDKVPDVILTKLESMSKLKAEDIKTIIQTNIVDKIVSLSKDIKDGNTGAIEKLKTLVNENSVLNAIKDNKSVQMVVRDIKSFRENNETYGKVADAASNVKDFGTNVVKGEYTFDDLKTDVNKSFLKLKDFDAKTYVANTIDDKILPTIRDVLDSDTVKRVTKLGGDSKDKLEQLIRDNVLERLIAVASRIKNGDPKATEELEALLDESGEPIESKSKKDATKEEDTKKKDKKKDKEKEEEHEGGYVKSKLKGLFDNSDIGGMFNRGKDALSTGKRFSTVLKTISKRLEGNVKKLRRTVKKDVV